jgi:hypothetical protein
MRASWFPILAVLLFVCRSATAGIVWETSLIEVVAKPDDRAISASFPFRNAGDATVKITGIQTSCGCTTAKADAKEVPPGGSASVNVRFDIGGRKGEQIKSVIVRTSDAEKHRLILKVLLPGR